MGNTTYYNNADLFNKLPPPYYLERYHHTGQQPISTITDLSENLTQIINYITNVSIGYGTLLDISTSHVWYDLSLHPTTAMPITVGGIPAGTTAGNLYAMDMTTLLNWLLFGGNMYPGLVAPSSVFSINPITTLYQIGANPNITFTTTFDRGSINPQSISASPYRSGLPTTYIYTGTGLTTPVGSTLLSNSQAINVSIGTTQSWTSTVSYAAGVQPYDVRGMPYDSPLPAGTLSPPDSITIEGTYPLFATTVGINTLTQQSLVSMNSSPVEFDGPLVPEANHTGKQKFDIPTAWISLPLLGIQSYNTTSETWEYEGGNGTTSLARWTTSSVTHTVDAGTINYTRYTYNGPDRSSMEIRLIF
jgi:hypothetical protein